MKFEIEDYREHKIWYNDDTDKFTVELLIEDSWREKGRKSLKECRAAIDAHIKANAVFKPFTCIRNRWNDSSVIKIEQVRSDGGLIFTGGRKERQTEISEVLDQLSGKNGSETYFEYNADYVEWMDGMEKLKAKQQAEMKVYKLKEPKLKPLDLSFVKEFMKPNA